MAITPVKSHALSASVIYQNQVALGVVEMLCPNKDSSLGGLVLLTAPAEGASNLLVLLSEADLTLSVTVTCVVNFAAIGMLPLWTILFETRLYDKPGNVDIPFQDAFIMFGYMVLALTAGFVLHRKLPMHYHYFWTYLPSLTILTLLFTVFTEVYRSRFAFAFVTPLLLCEASLLSACGATVGVALAFLCQQTNQGAVVLALETGARTTYVTSGLLLMSLDQPEADIAMTTAALVTLLTLVPALAFVCTQRMRRRYAGGRPLVAAVSYDAARCEYSEEEAGEEGEGVVVEGEEDEGKGEDDDRYCQDDTGGGGGGCAEKPSLHKCLPVIEVVEDKETCI